MGSTADPTWEVSGGQTVVQHSRRSAEKCGVVSLLLLMVAIVGVSIAIVLAARATVGPAWLHRIGWGVQQFRGFRPVWHYDRLSDLLGPHTGAEALVGATGKVSGAFVASGDRWVGQVFLEGAYWSCESPEPVPAGAYVGVRGVEGLTLRVSLNPPAE